jgi:predicted aspartyl protease
VRLKRLEIGPYQLDGFPASVNGGALSTSLLGLRALKEMGDYIVSGNTLTIGSRR